MPDAVPVWSGCNYVEYGDLVIDDVLDVACNVSAFGIFNSAEASVTLHCTYDPTTQTYEADVLGLARSYELFGKCEGKTEWKKGETVNWLWGDLP